MNQIAEGIQGFSLQEKGDQAEMFAVSSRGLLYYIKTPLQSPLESFSVLPSTAVKQNIKEQLVGIAKTAIQHRRWTEKRQEVERKLAQVNEVIRAINLLSINPATLKCSVSPQVSVLPGSAVNHFVTITLTNSSRTKLPGHWVVVTKVMSTLNGTAFAGVFPLGDVVPNQSWVCRLPLDPARHPFPCVLDIVLLGAMQEGSQALPVLHQRLDTVNFVSAATHPGAVIAATSPPVAAPVHLILSLIDKANSARGCTIPSPQIRRPLIPPTLSERTIARFLVCGKGRSVEGKKTGSHFWLPRLLPALFVQPGRVEPEIKAIVQSPVRATFCRPGDHGHQHVLEVREIAIHPGTLLSLEVYLPGEPQHDAVEIQEAITERSLRLRPTKLPPAQRERDLGLEYLKEFRRVLMLVLNEAQKRREEALKVEETLQELESFASWGNTKAALDYLRAVGDLEGLLRELHTKARSGTHVPPVLLDPF